MDAFLLAAGYGTRLRPLTDSLPKPMVSLCGKPLIGWNLELISKLGVKRVVVNTHYLKDLLEEYLGDGSTWGLEIVLSSESELLDTGGGLKKAWNLFSSSKILSWNSDVFIDPQFGVSPASGSSDYESLLEISSDLNKSPLITILVRSDSDATIRRYGSIGLSAEGRVVEFLGTRYVDKPVMRRVMFTGISVISKGIDTYLEKNKSIFSLTRDLFPQILHDSADTEKGGIWASFCNCYWNDIGTIDRLSEASKQIEANFTSTTKA